MPKHLADFPQRGSIAQHPRCQRVAQYMSTLMRRVKVSTPQGRTNHTADAATTREAF